MSKADSEHRAAGDPGEGNASLAGEGQADLLHIADGYLNGAGGLNGTENSSLAFEPVPLSSP